MKALIGDNCVLEYFKDDKNFKGKIYVDHPNDIENIDIEELDEIKEVYINSYPYYLAFVWKNYRYLINKEIKIIEKYNNKFFVYDYNLDVDLNFEIFKKIRKTILNNIYLYGNEKKEYIDLLKRYYEVREVNSPKKRKKDVPLVNFTTKKIYNSVPMYIFNNHVIEVIKVIEQQTQYTFKDLLDLILLNPVSSYNVFAFLAYVFEKEILKPKNIIFYSPSNGYRKNLVTKKIVENLSKDFNVYLFYNTKINDDFEKYNNSFFLPHVLFSYFEKSNIIVIPQLDLLIPKTGKTIYLLHDIYDSPPGKAEKKRIKNNVKKPSRFFELIDYVFFPTKKVFEKNLNEFFELKPYKCRIPGGYFKLDVMYRKLKKMEIKQDSIVFAPTVINDVFEDVSAHLHFGEFIIETLLENFEENIIFRPHPHSLNHPSTKKIVEKFGGNNRFLFDDNSDYLYTYARSKILITDISGTAFTYSFLTLRPVLFVSVDENKLQKKFSGISYLKDRFLIGGVVYSKSEFLEKIINLLNVREEVSNKIKLLRDEQIFNFGKSEDYFVKCVRYIYENKRMAEWVCCND